jgi:hypothetical protein
MLRSAVAAVLVAAACAIGVGALADTGAGADAIKFSLGVLRRDGVLVPFAAYDNGSWSVRWPADLRNVARPISLDDVPDKWWGPQGKDVPWRAWLDGRVVPLALGRPVEYPVFCTTRLGISTDYRAPIADPRQPTVPKDGAAIAGNANLSPIARVDPSSQEGRDMIAVITDPFNDEEEVASRRFTDWSHPFDARKRREYPITLETYLRSSETHGGDAFSVSYVEAVRAFPPGPKDNGCGLITYAHAWVLQQPGKRTKVDLDARVTYCDREGASFVQPFGRLHLKGDTFWVLGFSSWRDEAYVVMRLRPDGGRVMVSVSGGACER